MLNRNDWKLRKYRKLTKKILALEDEYQAKSDIELQNKTLEFRERLSNGETVDKLLVEAYATVREADRRVLGKFPYEVQVLGATILNDRNIAEMATGEGKTLTATMPMYLNGLQGPGAYLVTSSGYLAQRDAEEMGQVYRWLGLTVAAGTEETKNGSSKRKLYSADIIYTTYSAVGFDYLLDNLADNPNEKYQGDFRYVLIDEVDSVLLDLAQMPLVIAGAPKAQSNLFYNSDKVIKSLVENRDYEISEDQKDVWLTPEGIDNLTRYFGLKTILDESSSELYRHLVLALRANHLYTKNRDYLVEDGKVLLLDIQDGRKLEGIHLEAGMHQALEAKEEVGLSAMQKTMASVTYQNLFGMFTKLAGMTGTAATDRKEFLDIYNLDVLVVPPNLPNIREDLSDEIYVNTKEKLYSSLEVIKKIHATGQPVLIETGSVSLSELYSMMLLQEGIAHNVLNAKNTAREAQIIAEAGQLNTVTVATSMAGRGTDIKLGPGVAELGGLFVLGTERMSSRRVDNQLRGRAGRQGDPGKSQFYSSLDDRVVIENGSKRVFKKQKKLELQGEQGKRPLNQHLSSRVIKKLVNNAQKKASSNNSSSRMSSVQYDDVQLTQQSFIYEFRDRLINFDLTELLNLIEQISDNAFENKINDPELTLETLVDYINNTIDYDFVSDAKFKEIFQNRQALHEYLKGLFAKQLQRKLHELPAKDQQEYFLRLLILNALDKAWIEQVDNLHQLRGITSSRGSAHDPVAVYQLEAVIGFNYMKQLFWNGVVSNISLSELIHHRNGTISIEFP